MKLRIFFLTQWFDPEPTVKGLTFARELTKKGYEVEVITGFPNYPSGKIYPGYKIKIYEKQYLDGIHITRLPLYPSHGDSKVGRAFNYMSFSISALIYGLFIARRADIMYVYHPPLTVGIAACLIKIFRRIPVVYDIQDIWPDTLRASGMVQSDLVLNLLSLACSLVYTHVNYIVVLSHGFKSLLIERGVPESKISVIYNWADESSIGSANYSYPQNFPSPDRFKILFAGNVGKAQALETILEAACKLKYQDPNVCFVILGGGLEVNNLKKYAQDNALNNVVFLPPVSMCLVNNYLQAADILIVHLKSDPLFRITIPSKTQAYMAAGKPILMAVDGESAKLVESSDCGLVAKSEDADNIVKIILHFVSLNKKELEKMGFNGKNFYKSNLSLQVGVECFSKLFTSILDR